MPKSLEKEEDALQKILSLIEQETLDPAKQEADRIIGDAKGRAEDIVNQALKEKERILQHGRESIAREKETALASLRQAAKEGIQSLQQEVQEKFFEKQLDTFLDKKMQEEGIIEKIIDSLLDALKKEGLNSRFTLILPEAISSKKLSEMVVRHSLSTLESDAKTGDLSGGVQVKLKDKHISLDFSSQAIFDLLVSYIRRDLREILFGKDNG
jgi:V/A-type H+-transporting ATPase subunit E